MKTQVKVTWMKWRVGLLWNHNHYFASLCFENDQIRFRLAYCLLCDIFPATHPSTLPTRFRWSHMFYLTAITSLSVIKDYEASRFLYSIYFRKSSRWTYASSVNPGNRRLSDSFSGCVIAAIAQRPSFTLYHQGGIYLFELLNTYGASGISLLWLTIFESIAIGWLYDSERFYENVKTMIGIYPHAYFRYCYRFFAPGVATVKA